MSVVFDQYVPSLKWRQAEYQALSRLSAAAKQRIVPLITIPKIEYDFEARRPKHTIDEHLAPFAKRLVKKWGGQRAWLDVDPSIWNEKLLSGADVFNFIFGSLIAEPVDVVPVVGLESGWAAVNAAKWYSGARSTGIGLRMSIDELTSGSGPIRMPKLLAAGGWSNAQTDLIIDLVSPKYQPMALFGTALKAAMQALGDLGSFRSIVVLGTAFPESMKDVSPPGTEIPREDWLFYKGLFAAFAVSGIRPAYGDYTIVAPSFAADFDMRMVKPAGKLVYTLGDKWVVRKGGSFRDKPQQMRDHCKHVISSGAFRGAAFSEGDDYIEKCANGAGTSTLTRWKEIGISHHIVQVLEDVASFHAPAKHPSPQLAAA